MGDLSPALTLPSNGVLKTSFHQLVKRSNSGSSAWDAGQEVSKPTFETRELPWGGVELLSLTPAPARDLKGPLNCIIASTTVGNGDITS